MSSGDVHSSWLSRGFGEAPWRRPVRLVPRIRMENGRWSVLMVIPQHIPHYYEDADIARAADWCARMNGEISPVLHDPVVGRWVLRGDLARAWEKKWDRAL